MKKMEIIDLIIIVAIVFGVFIVLFAIPFPYSATEIYIEKEPYDVQETYVEKEPYEYEAMEYFEHELEYLEKSLNYGAKGWFVEQNFKITNKEDEDGCWSYVPVLYYQGVYKRNLSEQKQCISAKAVKIFSVSIFSGFAAEYEPSEDDFSVILNITSISEKSVTKTSVKDVEKTRTVTKYRDVEKARTVTKYRTLWERLTKAEGELLSFFYIIDSLWQWFLDICQLYSFLLTLSRQIY